MKKIFIITALLTYLVLNLGISLNVHYCGDAVSFIDFFPIKKKSCCEKEAASCCHNKLAVIQTNTIQDEVSTLQFVCKKSCTDIIPTAYYSLNESTLEVETSNDVSIPHFKFRSSPPLYVLNQVFRI